MLLSAPAPYFSPAQSLLEFHGNDGFSCTINAMVPAEWETFCTNKTRVRPHTAPRCEVSRLPVQELGGVLLTKQHKSPPLVYLEPVNGTAGASSLSLSPCHSTQQPHGSLHS